MNVFTETVSKEKISLTIWSLKPLCLQSSKKWGGRRIWSWSSSPHNLVYCWRVNSILAWQESLFGPMSDGGSKHSVVFSLCSRVRACVSVCWIIKVPNMSFIMKERGRPSCLEVLQCGSDSDFNLSCSVSPETLHSSYCGVCHHRL